MAVQNQPTVAPGSGAWSTDILACTSDMTTCCCALCCFPCMQCQTVKDFGWCPLWPLLDCCGLVTYKLRTSMRERYGIPGSLVEDVGMICCCYPCTWCQMNRELKIRQ